MSWARGVLGPKCLDIVDTALPQDIFNTYSRHSFLQSLYNPFMQLTFYAMTINFGLA